MKLKTRSVTLLTDDEVALVSGGGRSEPNYTTYCPPTYADCNPWDTLDCYSRECDPYETYYCSIQVCPDTELQCSTEECPGP